MKKKCFAKQTSKNQKIVSSSNQRLRRWHSDQPAGAAKGFAIAVDALLATVLTITVLTVIGFGMQSNEDIITSSEIRIKQTVDDTFTALNNSGTIAKYLADPQLTQTSIFNPDDPENPGIYTEAQQLLPKNIGLKVKVSEYLAAEGTDLDTCKATKNFSDCFGVPTGTPFEEVEWPLESLPNNEIVHGRKIAITKEISTGETAEGKECVPVENLELKESIKEKVNAVFLEGETGIETWIEITDTDDTPIDELSCDQIAKVTIRARNQARDPVAIVLAMDESGSMSTYDALTQEATGTFNAGTCNDEPVWVGGRFENGLEFNGITNYVNCGNDSAFNILGQLTIAAWIKIDNVDEDKWMVIIKKKYAYYTEEKGYEMLYNPGLNEVRLVGGGGAYAKAIGVDLDTGWHFIVGTIDNETGEIYVDTIKKTTWYIISSLKSGADPVEIGNRERSLSNGDRFGGIIDEIRLYNRVLTSEEINGLFASNTEVGDAATSLVAHWAFNETENLIAADSSGNGRNCSLQNWSHYYPEGATECIWEAGQAANPVTNCPATKCDYAEFTDEEIALTYEITPSFFEKIVPPYDSLSFLGDSTLYEGICTDPAEMRLWIERPDGEVECESSGDGETINNSQIETGVYKINVWSDAPVDYDIRLVQNLKRYVYDRPFGGGGHSGSYNPGESECTDFTGWDELTSFDFSDYNSLRYVYFRILYDAYTSIGGACGTPRFRVSYESNGSEWIPAKFGNGMDFKHKQTWANNDNANYIELPSGVNPGITDSFSFSTWFKGGERVIYDYYPTMFNWENDAGDSKLWIGIPSRNEDTVGVELNGFLYFFSGDTYLYDMAWHHLVFTYDKPSKTLTAYIDGEVYATPKSGFVDRSFDFTNSSAWIGTNREATEGYLYRSWFGGLDEVRLYNKALTTEEISELFTSNTAGGATTSLVAHWALNESTGYSVADSSGNGNNGTAVLDQEWIIGPCGTGDFSGCVPGINTWSGAYGPFLRQGTYKVEGWSDTVTDTSADVELYRGYQEWGYIYGDWTKSELIDGGTCSNTTCQYQTTPSTTANTNCPITSNVNPYFYNYSRLPGATGTQTIDTYNVSINHYGLQAEVTFDYTNYTDAVCQGAGMGLQNAFETDPNWHYPTPVKGSSLTKTFYINDGPSTPSGQEYYNHADGPPITKGDYDILGWAEEDVSYDIKWILQRIDGAKKAATNFMNNASWQADDEIGLVSFSNTAEIDQELTIDKDAVKNAIEALVPSDETGIANAINKSIEELELNAEAGVARFVILLTDGRANVCSDGSVCDEAVAIDEAIAAANDARDNHQTIIYVIGFAEPSLIDENSMKQIAKDKDAFPEECIDSESRCGKYYYAEDAKTLEEMYTLISFEIARVVGNIDIKIPIPAGIELSNYGSETEKKCGLWNEAGEVFLDPEVECYGKCSSGESTCVSGEELIYSNQGISYWWLAEFDMVSPCDAENCEESYVLFPPIDTEIIDNADESSVSWDGSEIETLECGVGENTKCHKRIKIKYADLNVAFTYGLLKTGPPETVTINFEIGNDGYTNIDLPTVIGNGLDVCFYKKEIIPGNEISIKSASLPLAILGEKSSITLDREISSNCLKISIPGTAVVDGTCSWKEDLCTVPYDETYWKIKIDDLVLNGCPNDNCTGTIIAEINQNHYNNVSECQLHNQGRIICSGERLRFFTIDYYAWIK